MNKPHSHKDKQKPINPFYRQVERKARRKIKARSTRKKILFALGMFGMVGWSVAIPTLIGIAIGVWIDTHSKSPYSWTLMLLVIGIALGCLNAWYWLQKEID